MSSSESRNRARVTAKTSANRVRNEAVLEVGDKRYTLRASFAALAEIEDAFDLESIDGLQEAIGANPGTRSIAKVIGPLIRAGGNPNVSDEDVRKFNVELPALVEAMGAAMSGGGAAAAGE